MKIYAIELLEDSEEETEKLTRERIDYLLDEGYTHYRFPDWTLHTINSISFLPTTVIGLTLRKMTHSRGIDWGYVAVMAKDWKPADTHPDDPKKKA